MSQPRGFPATGLHGMGKSRPRAWKRKRIKGELATRDGWFCWLCRKPIDPDLPGAHWMSGSIDHVMPFSKGGTNKLENLRLAHRRCNDKRGASLPNAQPPS